MKVTDLRTLMKAIGLLLEKCTHNCMHDFRRLRNPLEPIPHPQSESLQLVIDATLESRGEFPLLGQVIRNDLFAWHMEMI